TTLESAEGFSLSSGWRRGLGRGGSFCLCLACASAVGCPSPQPSPRSFLTGRGSRPCRLSCGRLSSLSVPIQMPTAVAPASPRIANLRWWIAGLLAIATALNYLDRQSFPVIVGEIRKEIPLTDAEYGRLTSVFLFAYAIMYAGGGRLMDWLGTRAGYGVMIVWWSAANFLTGTISSVLGLGVFRFLLGLGEGGGFPGSGKAVAEWFPPKERSIAFGLFNTGSSLGAVVAPPLFAMIVLHLNWRWTFFIFGSAGFLWTLIWLKFYYAPAASPLISASEREYIQYELAAAKPADIQEPHIRWRDLFRYRET